jgi:FHA domain
MPAVSAIMEHKAKQDHATSVVPVSMNRPQSKTIPETPPQTNGWSLEVVRGRELGRPYLLGPGDSFLGNALNWQRGLDLADQEGNSPRKMAGRHAVLTISNDGLTIRDLETPGGTFVNQQRLLSGQARRLVAGDVIQLGGVQLVVKSDAISPSTARVVGPAGKAQAVADKAVAPAAKPSAVAAPSSPPAPSASLPASPGRLSAPYSMPGGGLCRTWDDFLVLAAQSWPAMCDELMSGRLSEYLRRIHRPDLVPRLTPDRSADDQLDEWLARLPAAGSSAPELDVHPETVLVRAATGGGITQQTLRITNVGYRLLRCKARVEPPGTRWVRLRPEYDGRPFQTIDQTDLPIELELPETIDRPLGASIVIESNGGTRRVGVRIERASDQVVVPEPGGGASAAFPLWREQFFGKVARLAPVARIAIACAVAIALRLLVIVINALPIGAAPAHLSEPKLSAVGIILISLGMFAGLALASRRGERRDYPAAGFAGGAIGLLASALWFALLQSVERLLGPWATSIVAVALLWGLIGAALALLSIVVVPHRRNDQEFAR